MSRTQHPYTITGVQQQTERAPDESQGILLTNYGTMGSMASKHQVMLSTTHRTLLTHWMAPAVTASPRVIGFCHRRQSDCPGATRPEGTEDTDTPAETFFNVIPQSSPIQ